MSLLDGVNKEKVSPVLEAFTMEAEAEDEEMSYGMEEALALHEYAREAEANESMNSYYTIDEDDDELEAEINNPNTEKRVAKQKEDPDLGEDDDDKNFGNEFESGFESDMAMIAVMGAQIQESIALASEAYTVDEEEADPLYDPTNFEVGGGDDALTSEEAAAKLEEYMMDDTM